MPSSSLVTNLINSVRLQMEVLDQMLGMLQEQLNREKEPEDATLRCPQCKLELTDANDITTFGNELTQYACPNCEFRGSIPGAVRSR